MVYDLLAKKWVAGISLTLAIFFAYQPSILPSEFWSENTASFEFLAVMAALVASAIWLHRDAIQPYVLFLATTCLFIGGRFVAHALGFSSPVFSEMAFKPLSLSSEESLQLVSIVLTCLLAIHAGYFAYFTRRPADVSRWPVPTPTERTVIYIAAALVIVCAPLAVAGSVAKLSTCLNGNYLDLYTSSTLYASRWDVLSRYGLLIGTGLAFTSGNKVLQAVSLSALFIAAVLAIAAGIRSDFLAFVLLVTWLAHKRFRHYSLAVVVVVPVFMVASAQVATIFSCRAMTSERASSAIEDNIKHPAPHHNGDLQKPGTLSNALRPSGVLAFVNEQGTSLLSIHVASTIGDYPWPGYFQTFVPGFGLAAKLTGNKFSLSDLYFAQHMAKTWMPERYAKGEGFGWSIVSDMIVFSGGVPLIAVLLSGIFGFAFAALVSAAANSALWFGCLVVLMPKIVLLPRAGIYSIAPYATTFLIIFFAWQFSNRWVAKRIAPITG